jgi:hypothetical protein
MSINSNKSSGQTQQMMMMGLSSVACFCLLCVMAGAAWWLLQSGTLNPQTTEAPEYNVDSSKEDDDDSSSTDFSSGLKKIKYGSASLVVDPKNTKNKNVWFEDSQENDQHLWSFVPVSNKPDTYYIQSEQRLFKKGSGNMWLTGPADRACTGSPTVDKPVYADRQYWKVVPSGDRYQLVNVACENRRSPAIMMSSGARTGNGDAKNRRPRFTGRGGTPYTIE